MSAEVINVTELDISFCTGCESCKGGSGCIHDDDMRIVLDAFDRADVVVFSTPIRFNGPSSMIKTVLDRFQELWNDAGRVDHRPRYMGLLMTAGSVNPDPNPSLKIFRSFCASFGGVWLGHSIMSGTDEGCDGATACVDDFISQMMDTIDTQR